MALSKLAIGLIAGIGSVATVGAVTATVVASRQNSNQTIDSSSDEFKNPKEVEKNNESNASNSLSTNEKSDDSDSRNTPSKDNTNASKDVSSQETLMDRNEKAEFDGSNKDQAKPSPEQKTPSEGDETRNKQLVVQKEEKEEKTKSSGTEGSMKNNLDQTEATSNGIDEKQVMSSSIPSATTTPSVSAIPQKPTDSGEASENVSTSMDAKASE